MSPDDIVVAYPQLTLADVHAALAFYFDNRDEIERQMQQDKEFVSAMKAESLRVAVEEMKAGKGTPIEEMFAEMEQVAPRRRRKSG